MADPKSLYAKAMKLCSSVDENFIDLSRTLRDLLDNHPDEFQKFISNSNLSRRKVYYLVEIDKAFRKLPIPRAKLLAIGWTKAHILAKHINQTNAAELMELAETSSVRELKELVTGGKRESAARCVLFYYSDKEYALLEKALLNNGASPGNARGLSNKEAALMRIIKNLRKGG